MKREIKFRAWDKKDIVYFVLADLEQNETLGASKTVDLDKCEIMQYTGLKDKNGKEIYEGSIIDTHFNADFSPRYRPVVFKNGAFQLDPNPDGLERFLQEPKEFEVVGNIYENPEFLKL